MNYFTLYFQISNTLSVLKSAENFLNKVGVKSLNEILVKSYKILSLSPTKKTIAEKSRFFLSLFTLNFVLKVAAFYFSLELAAKAFARLRSNKIKVFLLKNEQPTSIKKKT